MSNDITIPGPPIYRNWQLALKGEEADYAFEVPLFTDAHITGMITEGYGPYQFINTVPIHNGLHLLQPTIVLRVESYIKHGRLEMDKTQDENYHGGNLADEVAALVSLCLGIRIKAGETSREFSRDGDPKGLPTAPRFREEPILPPVKHAPVLPRAIGTHSLDNLAPISKLHQLLPQEAIALIRAARLFQDGIWISESDPLLSWIMLVSAVEAAASYYWKSLDESAIKRLEISKPGLSKILRDYGDVDLEQKVADELADMLGATRKFRDFILHFLPDPPSVRPEEWAQVNWERASMKKNMEKIYGYRSRALHGGKPFPAPMGDSPRYFSTKTKAREEIPTGTAVSMGGHVWTKKDLPMNLHTFEYIVRNVILKWWEDMAATKEIYN